MKYTIFQALMVHFEAFLLKRICDLHPLFSFQTSVSSTRGGISSSASPSGSPYASPFVSPFGPPFVSLFRQSTPSSDFAIRSGRDFGGLFGGLVGGLVG